MIVFIITAIILLLFFVTLITDLCFVFEYQEKFSFRVRVWFISVKGEKLLSLFGSENETNMPQEPPASATPKQKRSPSDIIELISFIIDFIKSALGEFARYAKLKLCKIKILIATDDPAQTAVVYGVASTALYTALEFFDSFLNVKKSYKSIGVAPDFTSNECKLDMKIILKFKIIYLLLAFVHLLPKLAEAKKGK